MPNPNAPHTPLNADVGVTYTAGMHDQLVAQVLLTYARGGDCAALGVPHHVDRTLPMPMAGHVYLQTTSQWEGKHFRSEQKRPRIPDGMRCVPHRGYLIYHSPDDQKQYIAAHNSYLPHRQPCLATVGINGIVRASWLTFQGIQKAGNSTLSTSAYATAMT